VSSAHVTKLKHEEIENGGFSFSAVVRAEMKSLEAYFTTCCLSLQGIMKANCTCNAWTYSHVKCKHVAALFFAIMVVYTPNLPEPQWISSRKNKIKRFKPGGTIWKEIRGDLNFLTIKEEAVGEIERHNGKPLHVWYKPKEKKGRKKPTYCICNGQRNPNSRSLCYQ
jgi:hypothetical protein